MNTDSPHTIKGIELVRKLVEEGYKIFTVKMARKFAPSVSLSPNYLRQALHYLVRSGWLVRLKNGLYAVSTSVPGATPAHEFEIAMALVSPAAISHWSALHFHRLTDQASHRVFVLTSTGTQIPRIRSTRKKNHNASSYIAARTNYQFVRVKPKHYFGIQKIWVGETQVSITDPERTLLDCLARPEYAGDIAEVLHAFEAQSSKLDLDRIVSYAMKLDTATAKRLGWVLEHQGVKSKHLKRLEKIPVKGYRLLDSTGSQKGRYNSKWMIRENLPGEISS